nr:MAG TPA: hypothetical protein [Caudoviricetes sp.]
MINTDNIFKLPVYEEPIYIVVAVSDKLDIEKEVNSWYDSWLDLDLESLKSHVDYVYLQDNRYFFINVLKDKSEIDNPFLIRLVQAGRVILTCRYKICTNITSDKFEITEDKDTRTYSFKINNSENVITILDKHVVTLRDYANILFEFSKGDYANILSELSNGSDFVERVIAKENYAENEVAKSLILDIYNLVQNKIPDIIKSNIEIKPSINLSLKFI